MSYDTLLINLCTVQRFTAGATDGYGTPAKTWANHLVNQACRWSTPSNNEVKQGAVVVLADLQLFVKDIDVTEQDRIVIGTVTYETISVIRRQDSTTSHHKVCLLRTVK